MPRESTIKIQRSDTAAVTPSGLTAGELAVNLADRKLFVGGTAGSNITFLDSSAVVTSFNGLTGAVTGITTGGANTFTALNTFSAGISAAGGVTFSGTFSGATASFSKLLSASAGVSASALTVTTTGTTDKTAAINMASGVTATNSVASQISLYSYNADSIGTPPAPTSGFCSISSDIINGVDLRIAGSYDPVLDIVGNTISIGDVSGANDNTKITVNSAGLSVDVTGKLKPDQLVWETGGIIGVPHDPSGHPIYIRHSDEADPPVYTYPFYVSLDGEVTAYAVTAPFLYADSIVLNGHNILPLSSVVTTAAALSNVSTAQNAFPVGQQTLAVAQDTTYLIEGEYIVNSGTTTHTTAIGFTVGGDVMSLTGLEFSVVLWSAAANTITTTQSSIHVSANASTQTVLNATSTAAVTTIKITGVWKNTSNETITPKIKFSAAPGGTNTMGAGSYIRFTPIADPTVGDWT